MAKKIKFNDDYVAAANSLVVSRLGSAKAILWWATENPMFGGVAPYKMIVFGKEKKLFKIILDMIEGNWAP